jgi:hypothetical protein
MLVIKKLLNALKTDLTKPLDEIKLAFVSFSYSSYLIGIWQIGVGVIAGRYLEYIIDGGIWIILGIIIEFLKSRIAAVLIFIAILNHVVAAFVFQFYPLPDDVPAAPGDIDNDPALLLPTVLFAYRAMRATFKYRKLKKVSK